MGEPAYENAGASDADEHDAMSEWRASIRKAKWEAEQELQRLEREAEEQGRHWRNAP